MSLVENLARHQHRALDLLRDIRGLKERGYSGAEIARKIHPSLKYVRGVLRLSTWQNCEYCSQQSGAMEELVSGAPLPSRVSAIMLSRRCNRIRSCIPARFRLSEVTEEQLAAVTRRSHHSGIFCARQKSKLLRCSEDASGSSLIVSCHSIATCILCHIVT
jgi:hypothetical protein